MQSARLPAAAERPELREAIDSSARLTRFASAPGWAEQSDAPSEIGAWVAALLDDWWEDVDDWSRGGLAVPFVLNGRANRPLYGVCRAETGRCREFEIAVPRGEKGLGIRLVLL